MADQRKIQPQDLDGEQSLLGSMMLSKDAVALVVGKVKKEHFYKHRKEIMEKIKPRKKFCLFKKMSC